MLKRKDFFSNKKKKLSFTKGRQVDPDSQEVVRNLLGDRPRKREFLIEYLHLFQDKFKCLHHKHLVALASEMKMAMTEVYEVATFYAHFDVVLDGQETQPEVTIRVCDSLTCEMMGAKELINSLQKKYSESIRIVRAPCMGRCDLAPTVEVAHNHVDKASIDSIEETLKNKKFSPVIPNYIDFKTYKNAGGYKTLNNCIEGKKSVEEIIKIVQDSNLRGKGGAGFPSFQKWNFVLKEKKPRIFAVNADEGEPGTFKDRFYLESDPHRFLEGALIASWAVEADACYIYIRDEYPAAIKILREEIAKVTAEGLTPKNGIIIRRGAGAYICGEESAMLESIEGKRGLPRHKPPFPAQKGLFGLPTLIHNVETVFWLRDIIERGPEWYSAQGKNGRKGFHSFSVSGRVKKPGVKVAPAGITVRDLIDEYCGGMQEGHKFKGYLPGGASGGILPSTMDKIPLDFGCLEEHGCFLGSAAVVILSDQDNMGKVGLNLMRFFEDESCGQCTPCRVGTEKAVKIMEKDIWDKHTLDELTKVLCDASICGLGQAASNPLQSVVKHFSEDVGLSKE